MRIALVHRDLHGVTRGGICTLYRALGDALAASGHEVFLVTQDSPTPIKGNYRVVSLPRDDDLVAHRARVTGVLRAIGPTVTECSSWEAELLDYARYEVAKRAPILVRADLTASTMGESHFVAAEREMIALADRVVAVSSFAAADVLTNYGVQADVVVNGVDRIRFSAHGPAQCPMSGNYLRLDRECKVVEQWPLKELAQREPHRSQQLFGKSDRTRVLWVGKVTRMKGWDRLQSVVLASRECAVFLIVLGHGQIHYNNHLSNEGHVVIVQDVADNEMPWLYRWADYYLCTSLWEGFGLAIAEAMACGTPALVPQDLGVANELSDNGRLGGTYRDAGALIELLRNRPTLTAELPKQFDWSINAQATLQVYEELVDSFSR